MKPLASERRVIAHATQLAKSLDGNPAHTVAAAAMDVHGNLHSAVNVFHFTGGPCAELALFGAVAAVVGSAPLLTVAAVGDSGRGLLAPCGRCRQVMLDLYPDVLVAMPGADGNADMQPLHHRLPRAYRHPDASPRRLVRFRRDYLDDVATGAKTSTVRWDDPLEAGPALFVFEDHPDNPVLTGHVLDITTWPLRTLTAAQARLPADTDMDDYRRGLLDHYPDLPSAADVQVVTFAVEQT